MDLAVQEQRYEDANAFKGRLTDLKLHSQPLRLVCLWGRREGRGCLNFTYLEVILHGKVSLLH